VDPEGAHLNSMAQWFIARLPYIPSLSLSLSLSLGGHDSISSTSFSSLGRERSTNSSSVKPGGGQPASKRWEHKSAKEKDRARMLYGMSHPIDPKESFNLESLYVSICRKLHDEGF